MYNNKEEYLTKNGNIDYLEEIITTEEFDKYMLSKVSSIDSALFHKIPEIFVKLLETQYIGIYYDTEDVKIVVLTDKIKKYEIIDFIKKYEVPSYVIVNITDTAHIVTHKGIIEGNVSKQLGLKDIFKKKDTFPDILTINKATGEYSNLQDTKIELKEFLNTLEEDINSVYFSLITVTPNINSSYYSY